MLRFLKSFGYPCDLDLDIKYKVNGNLSEIIVFEDGKEIDRFYSKEPTRDRKNYARGFLTARGYKFNE